MAVKDPMVISDDRPKYMDLDKEIKKHLRYKMKFGDWLMVIMATIAIIVALSGLYKGSVIIGKSLKLDSIGCNR